jgi:hypothetical protein
MCECMCVVCGEVDYSYRHWCSCTHLVVSNQHTCEWCSIHLIRAFNGEECAFPHRCPICKGEVD